MDVSWPLSWPRGGFENPRARPSRETSGQRTVYPCCRRQAAIRRAAATWNVMSTIPAAPAAALPKIGTKRMDAEPVLRLLAEKGLRLGNGVPLQCATANSPMNAKRCDGNAGARFPRC